MNPRNLYFAVTMIGVSGILAGAAAGDLAFMALGLACALSGIIGLILVGER